MCHKGTLMTGPLQWAPDRADLLSAESLDEITLGRHIVIRIAYLDHRIFLVHDGLLASDKI